MTVLHREDGPAMEWPDGYQEWYFNGKLHREDGPAVDDPNGYKAWYLHGERFDEEQFNARKRSGGSITEKRTTAVYLSEHINEDNEESGGKKYTATDSKGNKQYIHVNEYGTKNYFSDREMTILHREDGPAIEWRGGRKTWYLNGKKHREDGPAVEDPYGYKEWWINGQHHREDGPAVVDPNGDEEWWFNGKLHREDGPALVWADGNKEWYLNGKELTEEEFNARKRSGGNITEQHKAIAIPRSRIDENGNTTPVYPHIVKYAEDEIEKAYTNVYLTEQKAQDSLPKRKRENNLSFKERYKPKTYWQLEEARRYGL